MPLSNGKMKILKISQQNVPVHWEDIQEVSEFLYPWNRDHMMETEFRSYFNHEFLFFRFKAFGPKPKIFIQNDHKLEVRHSKRVEIFFRENRNMRPYYCLEIDPLGRVLDYKANYYRDFDREWKWPDDLELQTKMEENYYVVSGKFKLATLRRMNLLKSNRIELGLYRGHCIDIKNGTGDIRWSTWIDPQTNDPDFHVPDSFGCLLLED